MATPTDEDHIEARRRLLAGLAKGTDANQLVAEIADLHVRRNTFPGEVFMELAADALHAAGIERKPGIAYRELLSKHLSDVHLKGKEHPRIQYAVLTVFAVHGGLEPDLLDEVFYWVEQYWQYALYAALAIIRHCAEHAKTPLETFVAGLTASHNSHRLTPDS